MVFEGPLKCSGNINVKIYLCTVSLLVNVCLMGYLVIVGCIAPALPFSGGGDIKSPFSPDGILASFGMSGSGQF